MSSKTVTVPTSRTLDACGSDTVNKKSTVQELHVEAVTQIFTVPQEIF
jgi:hypothetical protein